LQARNMQIQGISLEKRYLTDATVQGFPGELRQVFMNLIVNSIQAMSNGGRLRITVREHIDQETLVGGIAVTLTDTGTGIIPEHARQLFEPFFTTKSTKGTGLGLWISKGIIQKYDGSINFRSVRHRNGSTTCFRVLIPGNVTPKRVSSLAAYSSMSS
jgi:signal transduction histidine kinase